MADADAIRAFEHAGWEQAAETYIGSFAPATRPFIDPLLDAAAVAAGSRVLDVCCGPGHVTAAAAARGSAARGFDFSAGMLGVARRLHPALAFDQGDAEALPYADGTFDAVVSNFGIHHVPSPVAALRQAARVLRTGGMMAFSTWAAPAENAAWRLVFEAIRLHGDPNASDAPPPGGGLRSAEDCVRVLEEAGFTGVSCSRHTAVWQHADGAALLRAMQAGTARMAALIGAQAPARLPAIAAEIDRQAAVFQVSGGLAVPIAAYIGRGRTSHVMTGGEIAGSLNHAIQ